VEKPFKKNLGHLSWDEVFARQAMRAGLIQDWMDALHLKSGDRVLEIGAGPGFVSLALADRVGSTGLVYALDRSADALSYLERLQTERGISQIERIVADAHPCSIECRLDHDGPTSRRRPGRGYEKRSPMRTAGRTGGDRRVSSRRPLHERATA
jgi:SAM-dependent methyltransferase